MRFKTFLVETRLTLTLLSLMREVLFSLSQANKEKQEQLRQMIDVKEVQRSAKRKVYQSIRKNFNQLQTLCRDFAKNNKNSAMYKLATLPTTAYSYTADSNISNSDTMKKTLLLLVDALLEINELELSEQMKKEIANLLSTPGKPQQNKEEVTKDIESERNLNKQRQQVEVLINQVISELPKHHQHEARQIVAKADNKIAALDNFINNL